MQYRTLNYEKLNRVNHLAGELSLMAAKLSAARLRGRVAAVLLAITLPLEWAFGADFFAEFARDELGQMSYPTAFMVALKGLMLIVTVVVLKHLLHFLSLKARSRIFWAAGLVTVIMLVGVGLARNDLMHLKHQELLGGQPAVSQSAQLTALGLAPATKASAVPARPAQTTADLQQSLLTHTFFLCLAYVLISLGSAVCLLEIIEQHPRSALLKWINGQLAKIERTRALHQTALAASLAVETLQANRLVLLRAAQDLVVRTHLDGLSYTPWWRNSFRFFHLDENAKLNKAQAYGLRWLRAINCDPSKQELDACQKAIKDLKLVEPNYTVTEPPQPPQEGEVSNA